MKKISKYISNYRNPVEKDINEDIIYTLRNENLADYIIDAYRTIESKYLKIIDWELITDESKFDPYIVNVKYIKNNKNKKFDKRLPIQRSRYDLLKIKFKMSGKDGEKIKEIELLLFKRCNNYYYIIDGNKYYPIYQLVDTSTYNTKEYLTLKTHLGPIPLKRDIQKLISVQGNIYVIQNQLFHEFGNKLNPVMVFFSFMGYSNSMKFLQMEEIIRIERFKKYDPEKELCFPTDGGMYVKVIKYFFDNDMYTRTLTYMVHEAVDKVKTMTEIENVDFWVWTLGNSMIKEELRENQDDEKKFIKGKSVIFSLYRLLDPITKSTLRLKKYNKATVFAIIRWMLQNYNELKAKDNMDLANKRIRMGEYIASYVVKKLSIRMRKFITIMTTGDVKLKDIEELISTEKDFIIKTVIGSKQPLVKYDNAVNDTDLFTALKFTHKGPDAIGGKSANAINIKYRGIHPSYVGPIDINTTSTSDPKNILGHYKVIYNENFSNCGKFLISLNY